MNRSENINELATALAKAQSQFSVAIKNSENPHFRSRYTDIAAVSEAIRVALTSNGIAVVQGVMSAPGEAGVTIETMLMHSSGQWVSSNLYIPVTKYDAQGMGSAATYGRRYGLVAMTWVVADEDDDGNAAVGYPPANSDQRPAKPASKAQSTKAQALNEIQDMKGPLNAALSAVVASAKVDVKKDEGILREMADLKGKFITHLSSNVFSQEERAAFKDKLKGIVADEAGKAKLAEIVKEIEKLKGIKEQNAAPAVEEPLLPEF